MYNEHTHLNNGRQNTVGKSWAPSPVPKQSDRSFQGGFFLGGDSGEQKQNHNRIRPGTPHRKAWAQAEPTAIPIIEQVAVLQS